MPKYKFIQQFSWLKFQDIYQFLTKMIGLYSHIIVSLCNSQYACVNDTVTSHLQNSFYF